MHDVWSELYEGKIFLVEKPLSLLETRLIDVCVCGGVREGWLEGRPITEGGEVALYGVSLGLVLTYGHNKTFQRRTLK